MGKVLLANGNQELQDAVLKSLDRITPATITQPSLLQEQLKLIKRQGFATTKDELSLGANSIGVPVRGPGGRVVAALGVVIPSRQHDGSHLVQVLKITAEALSRKLTASSPSISNLNDTIR